tara:strand:- start:1118 stop:1489 length:372 start_codon:yes stop_codon:yes gene_type:complete
MAHFAEIDKNNIVTRVIVVDNEVMTKDGKEVEQLGIDFLKELFGHSLWVQTSYNGNFRKNYAGIGHKYDKDQDAFIPTQPFPSWTWNIEKGYWEAPVECPEFTKTTLQIWNEEKIGWDEVVIE